MGGELKKLAFSDLRQRGKKRKSSKNEEKRGKIQDITLIDDRSTEIDSRDFPCHCEGDLIICRNYKSDICVIVE
jgi:IS30 family transposase